MLIIGLLGLVFVTLKLTGYIFWAWYLVLAPFMVIGLLHGIWIAYLFVIAFKNEEKRKVWE